MLAILSSEFIIPEILQLANHVSQSLNGIKPSSVQLESQWW